MSIITPGRFKDENRVEKRRIETTFATLIDHTYSGRKLQNGYNYFGLTGPNLIAHLETYQKPIGRGGKFYIAERELHIFNEINKNTQNLPDYLQQFKRRIHIYNEDFFSMFWRIFKRGYMANMIIDLDFCTTYKRTQIPVLEFLWMLAKETKIQRLNIIFTCCQRGQGAYTGERAAKEIVDIFNTRTQFPRRKLECLQSFSYKEWHTSVMYTSLFALV